MQLYQKNAEIELYKKQQEKLTPLYDTIAVKISAVAEEQGFTHVLNSTVTGAGTSIVLYAKNKSDDLTNAVLEKLGIEVPKQQAVSNE